MSLDTGIMGTAPVEIPPLEPVFDFDLEYAKLKEKVKIFENAHEIKKSIDNYQALLQEKRIEAERADVELQAAKNEAEALKIALNAFEVQYIDRRRALDAKKSNQNSALTDEADRTRDDRIAKIKEEIEMSKEETALLNMTLEVEERKYAIEQTESGELQKSWVLKRINGEIDINLGHLRENENLYADAKDWCRVACNENSKSTGSETELAKLEAELQIERQSIETQIAEAVQKALEEERKKARPLVLAGLAVRGRKFEWQKPDKEQDKNIIELGNKASHYGMALADTYLYNDTNPNKRTDVRTFKNIYGVDKGLVIKHQDCPGLLEILDWRGAMKDIKAFSYNVGCYESSNFNTAFKGLSYSLEHSPEDLKNYLQGSLGKAKYTYLKQEYEDALEKHNAHLQERKTR